MDKQLKILHDLWKTAGKNDKPLKIPCGDESSAARLRFALYNAVKPVKTGKLVDKELLDAATNCSISYEQGDKTTLVIQQKIMAGLMPMLQTLVDPGVIVSGPAKTQEEIEIEESLKRTLDKVNGLVESSEAVRKTPYYTREN